MYMYAKDIVISVVPLCRYEQLAEQEEQSYQQLRRKLYSEVQVEKDKLTVDTSSLKEQVAKQLKELKVSLQPLQCNPF